MDHYRLQQLFQEAANPLRAQAMSAYMRNQFPYLGIKSPERKTLQKPFLIKTARPDIAEIDTILRELWLWPEREYKYFALDLLTKYTKQWQPSHLRLFEFMVLQESWWDTVDLIASKLMGSFFKLYPQQIEASTQQWLTSGNMWLQRSCLLYQLTYKSETDTKRLAYFIAQLQPSDEFFLNKASGWALRQYSKTDPEWVRHFVSNTTLSPMAVKEGTRLLGK
ncbi:DNA alkylation repair protein [Sediminicola luteus]|uniref:DNA alkylation repair protein n=1 Tax=Sediminicola luteus TaxID=319238 RepID=A0A2A4G8A9_9FLAO|nr:DNA alkylation repair protein [Sediminicola luteus]PCE64218.1 hypothetical protein B7P33_07905 [Sediminicola luteus]